MLRKGNTFNFDNATTQDLELAVSFDHPAHKSKKLDKIITKQKIKIALSEKLVKPLRLRFEYLTKTHVFLKK